MADFEKHLGEFVALGVSVVAASVDTKADAEKLAHANHVSFPIAYGLDAPAIARTYGVFYDPEDPYLHATGFIIGRDGKVATAVYATGPIGRLTAADTLAFIRHNMR